MSDYLSRAAQRAIGLPAEVRPALPSPFDSDRSFFAPANDSSFAPAFGETEKNIPRVEPSRNIADEQAASVGERVAAIKTLWSEPAHSLPVQTIEARVIEIREKETSVEVMGAPFVAPKVEASPAKSNPDGPEKVAVSSQSQGAISRRRPKTDSLSQPAKKPSAKPPPERRPIEVFKAGSARTLIGKPMPPRPVPVQVSATSATRRVSPERMAGPKSKSGQGPLPSDNDSPSADAIHVTIGRVEVRAIYPPAQPAPSRPPPTPKMSLDDYLRSRNGGKR
jgi:hypothetical protein